MIKCQMSIRLSKGRKRNLIYESTYPEDDFTKAIQQFFLEIHEKYGESEVSTMHLWKETEKKFKKQKEVKPVGLVIEDGKLYENTTLEEGS